MCGDFPAALETARTLGTAGRQHRVLGDIWWPQGDLERAAAAYEAARTQAEQEAVAGERAIAQAQRALVTAFTDPDQADEEITLARHLLDGLDLRATALTVDVAALLRDAGATGVEERAEVLRTEISVAGLPTMQVTLELALAFHHAVQNTHRLDDVINRLRTLTHNGDYPYYTEIAAFMGGLAHRPTSTLARRGTDHPGTLARPGHHPARASGNRELTPGAKRNVPTSEATLAHCRRGDRAGKQSGGSPPTL
ncbi:hypothetical protein ACFV2N_45780 [Streptomyces sp. NPDC059680]|uniref:hypothetical protein n=1 Tax=Streptomyces sp. NPDC059680 TaxID=3346904 RepID=UPI003674138F